MRILVLIAIGLLLYVIISNLFRKKNASKSIPDLGEMVRCQHCGLHILKEGSVHEKGNYFCCQSHLEAEQNN